MKVTVCSDNIFHIIASPTDTFSSKKSLIVVKGSDAIKCLVQENDSTFEILTSKIKAIINKNTGEIAFYNHSGEIILSEKQGGGKTFKAIQILGDNGYTIRQEFEPNEDEALYGLGQHQTGIMNYKGHTVDLWQRNTTAVVPFLISSKGYGILWDNYAFSKFGDINDTVQIPLTHLYNINGDFGSLTKKGDKWIGQIKTSEAGTYIFKVKENQFVRVKINNQIVIDQEVPNWIKEIADGKIDLEGNKKYPIEIEGIKPEQLIWQPPGSDKYLHTSFWSEIGDQIDYYFIYGPEPDSVISGYRKLTGKATMLPKSAYGFLQSRERYKSSKELIDVVNEFRKRRVPIDYIVQDWHYWKTDQWGSHEFDEERFSNPEEFIFGNK